MFKSLFANDSLRVVAKAKKTETRGRKTLSKRQKVQDKTYTLSQQTMISFKNSIKHFGIIVNTGKLNNSKQCHIIEGDLNNV